MTRSVAKLRGPLSLLSCLVLLSVPMLNVQAETADEQDQDNKTQGIETTAKQESTNAQQKQAKNNKSAKKKNNGEIFRPSEEISEDFAVSFPVDI